MAELILGFDVRCDPAQNDPSWTPLRRQQYLLRQDLRPLSVDESVWLRPDTTVEYGRGLTVETPKYRSLVEARAAANDGSWTIAISGWEGEETPDAHLDRRRTGPEPDWERLGWDVMDGYFPSALTNCGLDEDERDTLPARWSRYLNRWHLFDSLAAARGFRDEANLRIPEHAPFCVLGLYRV